jgi:hypothetical protein
MKVILFVLTLMLSQSIAAFDYKGIELGKTYSLEEIREKIGVECGAGSEGMQVCNGSASFASEAAQINIVLNKVNSVQRIALTLSPSAFEEIARLLKDKFGRPAKVEASKIQNRFGAQYTQLIHTWRKKGELELIYTKYAGGLETSYLHFSTKDDRQLLYGASISTRKKDM